MIRENSQVMKRDKITIVMKIFVDCLIQKQQIKIQTMNIKFPSLKIELPICGAYATR